MLLNKAQHNLHRVTNYPEMISWSCQCHVPLSIIGQSLLWTSKKLIATQRNLIAQPNRKYVDPAITNPDWPHWPHTSQLPHNHTHTYAYKCYPPVLLWVCVCQQTHTYMRIRWSVRYGFTRSPALFVRYQRELCDVRMCVCECVYVCEPSRPVHFEDLYKTRWRPHTHTHTSTNASTHTWYIGERLKFYYRFHVCASLVFMSGRSSAHRGWKLFFIVVVVIVAAPRRSSPVVARRWTGGHPPLSPVNIIKYNRISNWANTRGGRPIWERQNSSNIFQRHKYTRCLYACMFAPELSPAQGSRMYSVQRGGQHCLCTSPPPSSASALTSALALLASPTTGRCTRV